MEEPNLEYINQLSGDDIEFKSKIIAIVKEELPIEINFYHENLKRKDFKLIADCVHKLKHKISILGLEKSYYIAEKFENNLKQESTVLFKEFNLILETLQKFVSKL